MHPGTVLFGHGCAQHLSAPGNLADAHQRSLEGLSRWRLRLHCAVLHAFGDVCRRGWRSGRARSRDSLETARSTAEAVRICSSAVHNCRAVDLDDRLPFGPRLHTTGTIAAVVSGGFVAVSTGAADLFRVLRSICGASRIPDGVTVTAPTTDRGATAAMLTGSRAAIALGRCRLSSIHIAHARRK